MARSKDIAYRYAKAWLDAAQERDCLPRVRAEIDALDKLLNASAEFAAFLEDRTLPPQAKQDILTRLFQGKVETITLNFLLLLADKQRERLLPDILETCRALLDELDGIVNVEVTGAVALTEAQQAALQSKLEAMTGKRVRMHTRVNPALIGGFVVRVGDTVFDGSLATQIQRIKHALVGH